MKKKKTNFFCCWGVKNKFAIFFRCPLNPKSYILNSRSGFSLIELLLYIGILSVLVLVTTNIFISLNQGRGRSEAQSEVNSNLRFAIERISQDIRSASAVNTPAAAGNTSATLVMIIGADIITYDVSGGQLRRQLNSNTPESITADTVEVNTTNDPLAFTRLENINSVFSPPKKTISIEISMNIRFKSAGPDWQFSEKKETVIGLR